MSAVARVLDPTDVRGLAEYLTVGGGKGLDAARRLGPAGVIDDVEASGLRGRGGGGFPTGQKWRTVATNRAAGLAATVIVNAAEGEPGSFKDRELLRRNPYRVLEGALIGALAVGADRVVVALKSTFGREADGVRGAATEVAAAGWSDGVTIDVFGGPSEYLFGEETALLEVLDGRAPFPRVAPPYRPGDEEPAPTLVNNAETMANVPGIMARGADWFRSVGTAESPGTVVCTVSGAVRTAGVGEYPMGTPLRTVIDELGGGAREGQRLVAAVSGVANALLPETAFDTPLTYEAMAAAGSGLGAGGFLVFDDADDLLAVAAGVSRFLAVESCGQCTPCKQDGREIAEILLRLGHNEPDPDDADRLRACLDTVTEGARCSLAAQHQRIVTSVLELASEQFAAHDAGLVDPVEPALVAPITELTGGVALLDERQADKQPDWTYDELDSGKSPADQIDQGEATPDSPVS